MLWLHIALTLGFLYWIDWGICSAFSRIWEGFLQNIVNVSGQELICVCCEVHILGSKNVAVWQHHYAVSGVEPTRAILVNIQRQGCQTSLQSFKNPSNVISVTEIKSYSCLRIWKHRHCYSGCLGWTLAPLQVYHHLTPKTCLIEFFPKNWRQPECPVSLSRAEVTSQSCIIRWTLY